MCARLRRHAVALLATAAIALAHTPVRAEIDYPWCSVVSSGQDGMPSCRFTSLEQCRNYLSGKPGFCQPNPRVPAPAQTGKRGTR